MDKPSTSVWIEEFTSFAESIPAALQHIGADTVLAKQDHILIKPNLVNTSPPPVTTPVSCCAALIEYIQSVSNAAITVGEGCGDACRETPEIFQALGYDQLPRKYSIALVDLNTEPLVAKTNPDCPVFPEIHLPEIAFSTYVISLPVLKAHSLAGLTGGLKNMMGFAPPSHYSGGTGTWKKAQFHGRMQQSLIDLCFYRAPDLTVIDGSVGLPEFHLGGAPCSPPVSRIIAGFDAWEVDRAAADLLGLDWRTIRHIAERPGLQGMQDEV